MASTKDIELNEHDFFDPVNFQVAYLNQIPHPKQIEVLRSCEKNKIIVCGRRSGKTQMVAGELIRGAVLKLYPKQMVVAPTYKQTLIVFYKITELMQNAKVYGDIEKVVLSPRPQIVFKNGAFIDFGSADNPDSLRGEAYDRMFKDESAFIKAGANHAIKPLTYDTGAPTWETTTPWGKGEVWEMWLRGLSDDSDYGSFHYNYKDNPYLHADGIKEIEKDIEEYGENSMYVQAEIYGNFIEDQDVYFNRELVESCIESYNLGDTILKRYTYFLGTDVAGEGEDESVFVSILGHGGGIKVHNINFYEKNKPREIVGKVKELDKLYDYEGICLDKTGMGEGPADQLRETLSDGDGDDYRVDSLRFTTQSKMDIYSNLKKLMNQGKIKFPNHKKLINQLLDLRYEVMSSGDLKIHHSDKGHDDYPDALALACWAYKQNAGYSPTIG